jgi:hypothetical protein
MITMADHVAMAALLVLFGFVVFGALSVVFGVDSRPVDRGHQRRNWL